MAVVNIPDRNGEAARQLAVCWGVGNHLVLTPRVGTQARSPASDAVQVHEVRWETTLYEPVFRKLVNESVTPFLSLQSAAAAGEGEAATPTGGSGPRLVASQLVAFSRQYRSIIRDCQEQLDTLADTATAAKAVHYQAQSELLYKLELVWHLVEIQFVDVKPGGFVMTQLLHWVSLHFTQCQDRARSVLAQAGDSIEAHADYWDTLTEFVLQARVDQARNLLRLHSEFSSEPFLSLDELLRKMPVSSSAVSWADFDFKWRHWQVEVVSRLQEGDYAAVPQLTSLAQILAGREEAISAVADRCETWYQWMVARLLYTNPSVKSFDLSFHAQQAIDRFGGLSTMTSLDSVLLSVLELDLPQMMRELCLTMDNFWFPAHLLDLLHHSGQLNHYSGMGGNNGGSLGGGGPQMGVIGAGLREFLLLDYATSLLSHNSLWQLGALYMDHCPLQGKLRLEALLERVDLTSDYKASKVIQVAADRGLTSIVESTCKVMGMRALSRGETGSAMAWALKSQDAKFTTFLADKLLAEYTNSGAFSSTDLLDNLGSSIVVSDRLTFLGKYREFHRMVDEGSYREAASLLHSLLWSRLAPKYFWVTLLTDAVPFLTADSQLFTSEQTYQLMECLQDLSSDCSLPKKQLVVLEENQQRIRLSLARNLALALTKEGDCNSSFIA